MMSPTPKLIQSQIAAQWRRMCADVVERMEQCKMSSAELSRRSGVNVRTVKRCQQAQASSMSQVVPWLHVQYALSWHSSGDEGLLVGGMTLSNALVSLLTHMRTYVRVECDLREEMSRMDLGRLVGLSPSLVSFFFCNPHAGSMRVLLGQQFVFAALPRPEVPDGSIRCTRIEAGLSRRKVSLTLGRSSPYISRKEIARAAGSASERPENRTEILRTIARLSEEQKCGPKYLPPLPFELVDRLYDSLTLFVGADMTDHLHQTAFRQANATRELS